MEITVSDFTEGGITGKLVRFMLPILGALVLQAAYGAVDVLMVGWFGTTEGLSGVSTGSSIVNLVTFVLTGLASGITVILGNCIGSRNTEKAGRTIGAAVTFFFVIGIILTVLLIVLARPLALLMKAPPEAVENTVSYVRICGGGILFIIAYNVISCIMRGIGNSRLPLIFVAIACAANIVGDYTLIAIFKTAQWRQALDGVVGMAKQAYDHGFTQSELNRAVAEMQSYMRKSYNERATQKNSAFVNKAISHFLQQEPQFSEEYAYELYGSLLPGITLQDVDTTFRGFFPAYFKNLSIVLMSDENENSVIPSEEELLNAFFEDCKAETEPYKDEHEQRELISSMPEKGRIVKTKENKLFDATEYDLSNGAKVVIKTTDFKADEIKMYAVSHGGTTLFDIKDRPNYYVMNSLVSLGGMGDFSTMELSKQLSGIQASVSANVSTYTETVAGSSTIKDFETMLKLTYLRFTTTRVDSARYIVWKDRMANSLKLSESDPMRPISDTVTYLTYGNHERARRFTQADLDKVDYLRALELYTERVNNAADFVFIFVGNIDKEAAKPLIEQYIGALPSTGKHEKANTKVMPKQRTGYRESIFDQPMETPKTMVYITYSGKEKYNLKNAIVMSMLSQVMRTVYTETIREEEGGTYGVSTSGSITRMPQSGFSYLIGFDTNPEQAASLADRTIVELKKVADEGPSLEIFDNIKSYMLKEYESGIKENKYWATTLINYYMYDDDFYTDYLKTLNSVTPKDVQKMAKKVVSSKNMMKVIRYGVSQDKADVK